MCLVVYLASDTPIPPMNLVFGKIGFSIRQLQMNENYVFQNFSKRLAYYIGSAEGCGCGFMMDGVYPDMEEWLDARETYDQLSEFLRRNVKDTEFEIYACRTGQEGSKPTKYHQIKTADISKTDFEFEEGHFYTS